MHQHYKDSGVDIQAGYESTQLIKAHIAKTQISSFNQIGDFGGLFPLDLADMKKPILVSGTDGVGTKLKFAFLLEKHATIGIDCVAMCVNDILCSGAKPLFFLDYIALDKNYPHKVAQIVEGMAEGCIQAQCQLLGGETAEMPGFYAKNEYDVAGFCVGIVDWHKIPPKDTIKPKDLIIGIASSGLHSNGFSLVRKILQDCKIDPCTYAFENAPIGEALLTPTKIYTQAILKLLQQVCVKSIAHITGGGFYENLPRSLPKLLGAVIEEQSLRIPPIFSFLSQKGQIPQKEMFGVFNMGIGMMIVISPDDETKSLQILKEAGEIAYTIGEVSEKEGMQIC